jgi:hypothetical protein
MVTWSRAYITCANKTAGATTYYVGATILMWWWTTTKITPREHSSFISGAGAIEVIYKMAHHTGR